MPALTRRAIAWPIEPGPMTTMTLLMTIPLRDLPPDSTRLVPDSSESDRPPGDALTAGPGEAPDTMADHEPKVTSLVLGLRMGVEGRVHLASRCAHYGHNALVSVSLEVVEACPVIWQVG